MTATIRTATHTYRETLGADLSVSAQAGLTSGLSLDTDPALAAELAYRRERMLAARPRRVGRRRSATDPDRSDAGWMTRWISWLPSAPRRRSSAEAPNLLGYSS